MRILIADDSALVRRGVIATLSAHSDWEVCAEASDGLEALRKSKELQPDLVLVDIRMPGPSGLETARFLRQEVPQVKIIIMSLHDTAQLARSAREAGANACVDKARIGLDLVPVIENLCDGDFREKRKSA